VVLYTADHTIRARAVKASKWEPVRAMLPHNTIFIGASRSRKISAGNFFVATSTFRGAVGKPF